MSFVTLSFLVTTPECWVPALGGPEHGFPFLCGAGRLVVKDAIMMGAALVTMADSAKAYLRKRNATPRATVGGREPARVRCLTVPNFHYNFNQGFPCGFGSTQHFPEDARCRLKLVTDLLDVLDQALRGRTPGFPAGPRQGRDVFRDVHPVTRRGEVDAGTAR